MFKILKILRLILTLVILILFLIIKVIFKVKFNILPQDLNIPINYFDYSTQIMEAYGIYGNSKQFKKEKKKILANFKEIKTLEDVQNKLKNLIKISGGNSSYLEIGKIEERKKFKQSLPTIYLEENILFIKLPTTNCFIEEKANNHCEKYYNSVINYVKNNKTKIKAVILDLRNNNGGSFQHMLAAISPFIEDGIVLKYINLRRKYEIIKQQLHNGQIYYGNLTFENIKINVPVAVLQNKYTSAQAEHILISLKGRGNVKSFGESSKGLNCENTEFYINKDILSITTQKVVGKNYDENFNKKIKPDVLTDNPKNDATTYLKKLIK